MRCHPADLGKGAQATCRRAGWCCGSLPHAPAASKPGAGARVAPASPCMQDAGKQGAGRHLCWPASRPGGRGGWPRWESGCRWGLAGAEEGASEGLRKAALYQEGSPLPCWELSTASSALAGSAQDGTCAPRVEGLDPLGSGCAEPLQQVRLTCRCGWPCSSCWLASDPRQGGLPGGTPAELTGKTLLLCTGCGCHPLHEQPSMPGAGGCGPPEQAPPEPGRGLAGQRQSRSGQ